MQPTTYKNIIKERQGKSISHFVEIKLQIKDLAALADACRELKQGAMQIAKPGQKLMARGWYSNTMECDALIPLKMQNGADRGYDVALTRQSDGTYKVMVEDTAIGSLGKNGSKLVQLYGTHKVMRDMKAKGYTVARVNQSNGKINLSITGARL